ncbi:DNA repair protein SMC6 [Sugiyamaella lignohabitans]|uniref:DNA repair protein SMC6 n=1 Tax=Sugiyamaella lignohabitans TaxID=796027 RepID=A0A161HGQ0_9ASCO|nr:DNA repair protein SMC6 [Sugiyamaella lignohabitans]ANB11037.1 DNA repair protein SMC6 [Sugiyamaella lignohabitans]
MDTRQEPVKGDESLTVSPPPAKRFRSQRFNDDNDNSSSPSPVDSESLTSSFTSPEDANNDGAGPSNLSQDLDLDQYEGERDQTISPTIGIDGTPEPEQSVEIQRGSREMEGIARSPQSQSAGKIISVQMINFMCHSNLTISLGRRINFIVGKNGSGKSAVLTAIIIGLGGRASDTDRGSSISDVIKEGQQMASIRIKFDNVGKLSFRHEIYGDFFTLERAISRTERAGHSNYNVYTQSGKKMKISRTDILEMLSISHFSIDIDNQFAILTQDQARTFLVARTQEEMYHLLMRGLRVTQSYHNANVSNNNITATESDLKAKRTDIKELKEKVKNLELRRNNNLRIEEAMREVARYTAMGLWFRHDRQMEKISQLEERNDELKREQAEKQDEADAYSKRAQELVVDTDSQVSELRDQRDKSSAERLEAINRRRELSDKLDSLKQNQVNVNTEKNKNEQHKVELESELNRLTTSEGGKEYLEAQIETVNLKINELKEEEMALVNEAENFESKIKEASDLVKSLQGEVKKYESSILSEKSQLAKIQEGSQVSVDAAYGVNMANVLKEISMNSSFHQKPIGPLGQFVSLKIPTWGPMLEHHLRHTLAAFWTKNTEDRNLLLKILAKYKMTNTVIVKDVDMFDYSWSSPSKEYTTVLDALEFKDESVKRIFIDQYQIHRILLIEDRAEADRVMYSHPKNALVAFAKQKSIDGSQSRDGFQVGANRGGSSSSILRGAPVNKTPRMGVDLRYRVKELEDSIRSTQSQCTRVRSKLDDATRALGESKESSRQTTRRLSSLRHEMRTLDEKRDDLQTQLEDYDNGKVLEVQGEIENCKQRIETYILQFEKIHADMLETQEDVRLADTIIAEADKIHDELCNRIETIRVCIAVLIL